MACTERMRSGIFNRLTIRLSLLTVFSAIGVTVDYAIGALRLIIGISTTDEETDHEVQVIVEEARWQLTSVS